MKKWLLMTLTLCLVFLAACGQSGAGKRDESYMPAKPDAENTTFDWGVTMTVKDFGATGCTLEITQSGGSPTGEVTCGCDYWLEQQVDDLWTALAMPEDVCWTAEAYMLSERDFTDQLNWKSLYGTLPSGTYRVGKSIMDWRAPGDLDTQDHYSQPFVIE